MSAQSPEILKDITHPATVCSDTEVSVVPPDYRAASLPRLWDSWTQVFTTNRFCSIFHSHYTYYLIWLTVPLYHNHHSSSPQNLNTSVQWNRHLAGTAQYNPGSVYTQCECTHSHTNMSRAVHDRQRAAVSETFLPAQHSLRFHPDNKRVWKPVTLPSIHHERKTELLYMDMSEDWQWCYQTKLMLYAQNSLSVQLVVCSNIPIREQTDSWGCKVRFEPLRLFFSMNNNLKNIIKTKRSYIRV